MSRSTDAVDYRALADFRYAIRRFLRFSEDAARDAGLEPRQHQLLLAVKGAPADTPVTVSYLAERLQLKHHSVVGLLDRLARRGLAVRRRDPTDHRRAVVSLTAAGERPLHALSVRHGEELRQHARQLTASVTRITKTTR